MIDMILIYIPCMDKSEALKIGDTLMGKRLCPCYNIITSMHSAAFWPPKSGGVERMNGVVLLIKTIDKNYHNIELEVKKLHSDKNPCVFAIPVNHVSKEYFEWMQGELSNNPEKIKA
jgi:periplasmic divalent cation tolerance protein